MWLLGFSVTSLLGFTIAFKTGFRAAITDKGFNYIDELGLPILKNVIENLQIPDITGRNDEVDYTISEISLFELEIGSSEVKSSSNGVIIEGSDMTIKGKAHWHWRVRYWPHITESGSIDLKLHNGVKIIVTVRIVKGDHGEPVVKPDQCSMSIPKIDVNFHGDAKWLYNLFDSEIAHDLRDKVKDETCDKMFETVVTYVSNSLASLPLVIKIPNSNFELSYELVSDPHFDDDIAYTEHRGEFLLVDDQQLDAPFSPSPLPEIKNMSSDKMMYLWVTGYVVNTAGFVFQEGRILHYNIKPDMIPENFPLKLNTSSFKFIVPTLYGKFPNMAMEIYVNSTKAPWVQVGRNNANVSVTGTVGVNVVQQNGTKVNAFTLGVMVHSDAFVWMDEVRSKPIISANCSMNKTKFDLSLVSSNIGDINIKLLGEAVNLFIEYFVLPILNRYGNAGLVLPVIDGLSLVDPHLTLNEGYVLIDTDFHYVQP